MAAHQHTAEQRRAAESWDLVAAAQGGDREAFGALYARYQPQIASYIGYRVTDHATVQDLCQDTFVKALRNIGSVSDQGTGRDPGAWLSTIARNVVFDHAKSYRIRNDQPCDEVPEPRGGGGQLGDDDPENRVLASARRATARQVVGEAMRGLTPAQRQAAEAYARESEGGHAAVGAAMGRSAAAVKTLRYTALAKMRAVLAEQGLSSSEQVSDQLPDPAARSAWAAARARVSVEQARDALYEQHRQPAQNRDDGNQATDGRTDLAEHHSHTAGGGVDAQDPDLELGAELGCGRVA